MENKTHEIINQMIEKQLIDPQSIRMADGTTFVYNFWLTPKLATALGLPGNTPFADITLDLMMEFMTVIGLDENGNKVADGHYPEEIKGPFIRRIFDLYGKKVKAAEQAQTVPISDAEKITAALSQISMEELMGMPANTAVPAEILTGEEPLTHFFKSESVKQVRRFYLNYPANDKEGHPLHLYIETEVDEDDPSYLNYWVGCEEHTAKRYIASCQAPLDQENPLEIVKAKHLNFYIDEILK